MEGRRLTTGRPLANVSRVSSGMEPEFAAWLYGSDPNIRQVYAVAPASAEHDPLERPRLVVVRTDLDEPREIDPGSSDSSTFPPHLWEVPEPALSAARAGALQPPAGFETDRWQLVEPPATRPPIMRVERIELQNVRCFESIDLTLQPGFTLLIGNNGAGKTTVLDALAHCFRQIVRTLATEAESGHDLLTREDIRLAAVSRGQTTTNEPRYPARVQITASAYGVALDDECGWKASLEHTGTILVGTGKSISPLDVLDFIRWSVATDHNTPLPVFAYYRASRTSAAAIALQEAPRNGQSRLSGYRGWERSNADLQRFEQWLERKELEQFQRGVKLGVLKAVKEATRKCLRSQGLDELAFDASLGALAARSRNGPSIPFSRQSAGVRNMFGLVVDLAVRCAMLNPHLGPEAAKQTAGVVLIDELDLHLHPTWQRHVIEDLRAAFPCVQFIVTTHSGLLVSSLRASEIVTLELDDDSGRITARTHDQPDQPDPRLATSSELYQEFFGVSSIFAQALGRTLDDYRYWARNPHRDEEHDVKVRQWRRELLDAGVPLPFEPVPRRPYDTDGDA
jgi:predicted ATP-binding protein involved in virulence